MTDRYAEGWRDACQAINQELDGIAPRRIPTILAAVQVRDIIERLASIAVEETRPELTPWQQRLTSFGIRP
jgi:hypothetical protein